VRQFFFSNCSAGDDFPRTTKPMLGEGRTLSCLLPCFNKEENVQTCSVPAMVKHSLSLSLNIRPYLVRKNFQDFPSNRIFGRMYRALNIDENKN
jgi:hypothetical protein